MADPVQQLQQQGVAGRELPMYDKEKVYAGVCEFSLEEIRAAARGLYRGRTPHRGERGAGRGWGGVPRADPAQG